MRAQYLFVYLSLYLPFLLLTVVLSTTDLCIDKLLDYVLFEKKVLFFFTNRIF